MPTRSLLRTMLSWALIAFGVHSAVLLLLAPSAFMFDGEGFVFSGPTASLWQRLIDAPVSGLVREVVNYRLPLSVHLWVAGHARSLDEASLLYGTVSLLIAGGAFYALVGGVLGTVVWSIEKLKRRSPAPG